MAEPTVTPSSWKRDFAVFLSSQALSLLGSSLVQYAITWHITLTTKSGLMMTLAIVFGFVPAFVLSPFAGVWADRYDRKRLIMLSDGFIALVTLATALVYVAGYRELWVLFAALAARSAGSAIQQPAVGAILPQFVPTEKLMRANGINQTFQSLIMLGSPVLSGALLSVAPVERLFFLDVATAAVAIGVLGLFLKVRPHERATRLAETGHFEDMKLGFRYIRDHRYLLSFFSYVGFFLFAVSPAAFLTPLQVTRTFGAEVWRLSAVEVAFSAGMTLGGFVMAAWGGFRNRMRTMLASGFVMAACTMALALMPSFWAYLAVMAVFGVALPVFNAPSAVILQDHVETEYLGRVFSVLSMLHTSLMPIGMLVFGPLADVVRVEWLLLGTGAAMFAQNFVALGNRRLVEAGEAPGAA